MLPADDSFPDDAALESSNASGGSGSGSSPTRRGSMPPHMRIKDMALSPSSPLYSGAAILIRHRESESSLRPKLRSEEDGGGSGWEEGGFQVRRRSIEYVVLRCVVLCVVV